MELSSTGFLGAIPEAVASRVARACMHETQVSDETNDASRAPRVGRAIGCG